MSDTRNRIAIAEGIVRLKASLAGVERMDPARLPEMHRMLSNAPTAILEAIVAEEVRFFDGPAFGELVRRGRRTESEHWAMVLDKIHYRAGKEVAHVA